MRPFGRHVSFEARLSGLVAVAVGVAIALAALASYLLVDHQLHGQAQSELQTQQREMSQVLDQQGYYGNQAEQAAIHYVENAGEQVQVVTSGGQVWVATPEGWAIVNQGQPVFAPTKTELRMAAGHGPQVLYTDQRLGPSTYRVMTMQVRFADGPAAILQIGRSLSDVNRALADLRIILVLVTAGGIAVALAIGTAIARATLRPVERLRAAAEHVAETQSLDATIDEEGDDELARLAHAFNAMLTALRQSRQQQAQLVSDAGHELRTPLTSLRTNIEFLMRAGDLPDQDRRELLDDVRDQLEELTLLVGDIVETSRQEEHGQAEPTEARLDAIVQRAVERARRRAPSLHFDVALTPGSVRASPALLERAVLNVLDNAAKWSPPASSVEVRLARNGTWVLDVRDHGPGIDPEDVPKVFDRFYRAATARSMPGSGLGLAIVRDVVVSLGGSVGIVRPADGGTLVRMTLPTVDEDEPEGPAGAWPGFGAAIAPPPPPPATAPARS